jgi:O-6-methylguanine DNA methyltransferase
MNLAAESAALAAVAPADPVGQVVTSWVRVPGPAGELYVAFAPQGVRYVSPVAGGWDRFRTGFAARFAAPLAPRCAEEPPAGLLEALRTGDGRGLAVDLSGCSEFDRAVLAAALRIPRGQTRSYAWVAREAGHPRAVRATGSALGRNPVAVLIPCHRVIRSDGGPGGYGFGLPMKAALLEAERACA